jgi:hypothetical protein
MSSLTEQQIVQKLFTQATEQGRQDPYIGKRRWTRYYLGTALEGTQSPDTPGTSIAACAWAPWPAATGSGARLPVRSAGRTSCTCTATGSR